MDSLNVKSVYALSFLDSLSYGLVMPILSSHIQMNNGNHTIVAVLVTFHLVFQFLSKHIANSLSDVIGKKETLLLLLLVGLITNVLLGLTLSFVLIIGIRLLYYLTNQTQNICRTFVVDNLKTRNHSDVYNVLDALGVAGFVVGPVIGGHLFDLPNGFFYVTQLLALISFLSLILGLTLPTKSNEKSKDVEVINLRKKITEALQVSIKNIENADFSINWDVYIIKVLFSISMTSFFAKYSLLLRFRFNANATIIGYTVAYQSILMFLSSFINLYIMQIFYKSSSFSRQITHSICYITLAALGLCFAPQYDMYLVCFIVFATTISLFDSIWKKICQQRTTESENVENSARSIVQVVDLIMPLLIGIDCDMYGYQAVQILTIAPLLIVFILTLICTFDESHED